MEKFVITGGNFLRGEISLSSAKNSFLPILAGTILSEEEIILKNCPNYIDILNMTEILKSLGADVKNDGDNLIVNQKFVDKNFIPSNLTERLRSSIFTLGALLGRFREAKVAYPGGCDIGLRPIDLHLKGLRDLGVKITETHGFINCDAKNLKGGTVYLDFPSVGATENLMMAGVLSKGKTTILNPAKEPEIVDLQNFLNTLGAKISGAGTNTIVVEGVKKLHGGVFTPIPDRILGGTILIACAMTGGKVVLKNCVPEHLFSLLIKLKKSGCKVKVFDDLISFESFGRPKSVGFLKTAPYPGFPTDLQSQMFALQTISKGNSVVEEKLFETRFGFVPELVKMGAKVKVSGQTALINGVKSLQGADVFAGDLRGGAALVLAGLVAEGYTTVHNVFHIDRGYDHFENTLATLGANIKRID